MHTTFFRVYVHKYYIPYSAIMRRGKYWRIDCYSPIFYPPVATYLPFSVLTSKSKFAKYFPTKISLFANISPPPHNCMRYTVSPLLYMISEICKLHDISCIHAWCKLISSNRLIEKSTINAPIKVLPHLPPCGQKRG